jgi:hypothetical protein
MLAVSTAGVVGRDGEHDAEHPDQGGCLLVYQTNLEVSLMVRSLVHCECVATTLSKAAVDAAADQS